MSGRLAVIGVPTSAGAFAAGQERAPQALRDAGLLERLRRFGIVRETGRRVRDAVGREDATLVLGGDCTVGIGTVAGHVAAGGRVALVCFDTQADLNVRESVPRARSTG